MTDIVIIGTEHQELEKEFEESCTTVTGSGISVMLAIAAALSAMGLGLATLARRPARPPAA